MNFQEYIKLYTTDKTTSIKKGENTNDLYENYLNICKTTNISPLYVNQTQFTKQFKDYKKGKSNGKTTIIGVFIKDKQSTIKDIKDIKTDKKNFNNKIYEIYEEAKDNIFNTDNINNTIYNDNNEYLKNIEELVGINNNWSLAVRAQMGMGKTEKLIEYIIKNNLRVLIVSFRKSLIAKQFKDLEKVGFKTYLDFEGFKIQDEPKLIVQIDSIYKVYGYYDLIIFDEIKSISEQLVLQTKNKKDCIISIIERVKMTPMLYIADANLNSDDLEFFNRCNRKFVVYNNTFKKHINKKMTFIENKNIMLNSILNDLKDNKKIILATGSKEYAISVGENIIEKLPNIKLKIYTGGNKYDKDPTEEWSLYDCIIYTSCICAGNSYIQKHFNNVYGYFPACSNSPNIALQMLFRCRNFENLFICIEERGTQKKLPFKTIGETKEYFIRKDKIAHKDIKLYVDGYYGIKSSVINNTLDIEDPYFYMFCNIINTINKGRKGYLIVIIQALKEMGLTINKIISINNITDTQQEEIKIIQDDLKIRRETHELKRLNDTATAIMINKEQYKELQRKLTNNTLNNDEYNQCKKYTIKEHFKITEETITPMFIDMIEKHGKKLDRINHIINNFNDITNNNIQNIVDNLNKTHNNDDITDFIEAENILKYKHISCRLKNTNRLFTTQQIFKIYDMLCAFLDSSTTSQNKTNNKSFNYNEIFLNDNKNKFNIDTDILTNYIYDVIKPFNYFGGLPKRINFDTTNLKEYKQFINKLIKYINDASTEYLGISIKKEVDKETKRKKFYLERLYILTTIPKTNFKYAIHKDFNDKINFSDDFINKSVNYISLKEEDKDKDINIYSTFEGIDPNIKNKPIGTIKYIKPIELETIKQKKFSIEEVKEYYKLHIGEIETY